MVSDDVPINLTTAHFITVDIASVLVQSVDSNKRVINFTAYKWMPDNNHHGYTALIFLMNHPVREITSDSLPRRFRT